MGVSQGMVSKWESREYNFTVKTLNEICEKLKLYMTVEISTDYEKKYIDVKWDKDNMDKIKFGTKNNSWIKKYDYEGAIA